MRCKSFENFFLNFANKTKLDIILLLKEGPLCVTDITKKLSQEQSRISHNLKKLVQCRILAVEQKGKQRIYRLNKETIVPIIELVKTHVKCHCQKGCHK